jgi:hypothetical protein
MDIGGCPFPIDEAVSMRPLIHCISVAWACIHAASAGAVEAKPNPPSQDQFAISVATVSLRKSVDFPPAATATAPTISAGMRIKLDLSFPKGLVIIGASDVRCTTLLSDAQEDLAPRPSTQPGVQWNNPFAGANGAVGHAAVELSARFPERGATKLAALVGEMNVLWERTPAAPITLSPAIDWIGRRLEIPQTRNAFSFLGMDRTLVRCGFEGPRPPMVKKVAFFGPDGKELDGRVAYRETNDAMVMEKEIAFPPDGTIQLVPVGEVVPIALTFSLSDIPLTEPIPAP